MFGLIVLLLPLVFIIVPLVVFNLIKDTVKAKEQGEIARQWFLIWAIGVITLVGLLLLPLLLLLYFLFSY